MLALLIIIVEAVVILFLFLRGRKTTYDGNMVVYDTDEKKTFSLEIKTDPEKLDLKKQIVLKVTKAPQ